MARSLSIIGFLALVIGLLWIGQGTGAIPWPRSSFMVNQYNGPDMARCSAPSA